MKSSGIYLSDTSGSEVAYVCLPDHPGKGTYGIVKKTLRLHDLLGAYSGPDLYFDFDENGVLIGIEILAD